MYCSIVLAMFFLGLSPPEWHRPLPSPAAPAGRGGAEPARPRCPRSQRGPRVWDTSTPAWHLEAPFRHQLLFLHRLFSSCCRAGFTQKRPSYL